jgi:hypothetical protein
MDELTHPVELTDEELDLVAAGNGSLINVSDNNVNVSGNDIDVVQANVAVGGPNNQQNF